MTIVDYLVRQARAIVTDFKYFEMSNNDIWGTYSAEVRATQTPWNASLASQCGSTWATLLVGADTKLPHDHTLYTQDLVARFESLSLRGEDSSEEDINILLAGMAKDMGDMFERYRKQVALELGLYFSSTPSTNQLTTTIRSQVERKVEWILYQHGVYHYQRPLPLLTPSVVTTLAKCMDEVNDAVSEVSLVIYPPHIDLSTRGSYCYMRP